MDRINGAGHINRRFVQEDTALGRPPTEITDEWLNSVQEEIVNAIAGAGIPLNGAIENQLLAAINALISAATGALAPKANPTFSGTASFEKLAHDTKFAASGGGEEGGQIRLERPTTGATFTGDVIIDLTNDFLRIFESGGANRGIALNIANCGAGTGSVPWTSTNDGPGSGLDADLLDGQHGSYFAPLASPVFSGRVFVPEGTAALPGLSFVNDGVNDTGFFHISDGVFGIACNGVEVGRFSSGMSSLGASGYQKLLGGLILQWQETSSIATNSSQAITFPVTFPNACLAVFPGLDYAGGSTKDSFSTSNRSTTGCTVYATGAGGVPAFVLSLGH